MTTELIERPETTPTPLDIIRAAMESGLEPAQMKELMQLQREWESNRAAEAFSEAVTAFQATCPVVTKSRKAGEGGFGYKYAAYEDVMKVVGPFLKECGLALTFSSKHSEAGIEVTLRIRHGIHFEDHTLTVPVPSMRVNDTQRYGAALSYAKRYALCAGLNIVVADEDSDAGNLDEPISFEQSVTLREWMDKIDNFNLPGFLKWANCDKLESVPASKFSQAVDLLQRKARDD